ncbi:MarR family winged helix-turn-helix transcriptional regulator [Allorhizobium undicola]|uniref:MarR family winged helix-turn-helix transcriptional regulator n=1 Tax=Allorhizobium undicola TaxID=78527 RepID=UPI00048324B7|nr:MarR family transcriptional regulator [Allorhizobium undicola]
MDADGEDAIDRILAQWGRERPELDVAAMGLFGRLGRVGSHVAREIETVLTSCGVNSSSFDVLATLRRAGAPYRLSPSALLATMMVTSGTMTNRIDQLEKQGLVARVANPEDRRSLLIALTQKGLAVADRAVNAHNDNLARLADPLLPEERARLDELLKKFLRSFEG